ncbi:MAG: DUF5666 domain-containing protein, partial [Candidatus Paceibacterota bacterium]
TKDSSGNITATSVNVVTKAPEFREPHKERGSMGAIASINGSTFTITTRERGSGTEVTKTITVSSDTKYTKDRDTVITLSDLATGQKVMIEGTKDSSGNITATSVNVVTKAPEFREPHKERGSMGAIASINGSTFTITTRERDSGEITKTITVSSDTKYTKDRDNVITLSDLTVGQKVMIEGTKDSSGNITATSVNVVTKAPANPEQE